MGEELLCECCGIAIRWQPTLVEGKIYCCSGCAGGGPCHCDYDNLPAAGELKALVRQQPTAAERAASR